MTKAEILVTFVIVCIIAIAAFVSTIPNGRAKRERQKRELERRRWERMHGMRKEEEENAEESSAGASLETPDEESAPQDEK